MPYIKKEDRELIDGSSEAHWDPENGTRIEPVGSMLTTRYGLDSFFYKLEHLRKKWPNTQSVGWHPGTLNYIITRLCDFWCRDYTGEANYERYNAVIGVLECVKQELYRRQIAPYEDKKWQQNGDVYDGRE